MEPLPKTINDLVTEVREDLDEELYAGVNFWDDSFIIGRLNRGFRELWQAARETHENWFVRKIASTDQALTIYGRTYDPASLQLGENIGELVLPPDLYEIVSLTGQLATDGSGSSLCVEFGRLGSEDFRAFRGQAGASGGSHLCDVVYREGGPVLVFSPNSGVNPAVDVLLEYVFQPKEYVAGDLLENSGFNRTMLDAAVAYAVLEAREKEDRSTDAINRAERKYARKLSLVTRSAGPRQTQNDEIVEGFMEWDI